MRYVVCLLAASAIFVARQADAQVIMDQASTVGESYARGASDMMRASGERNLMNSQAAINAEDAYSSAIDNSIKSTNAFWERRAIYEQHEQQKLYEIGQDRQRKLARHGLQSFTPDEFDRTTGTINWPKVLTQSQYDEYRNTLDQLFHKRAEVGYLTSEEYLLAQQTNKAFRDALSHQRDMYPRNILTQMLYFILKLNRELDDNLS